MRTPNAAYEKAYAFAVRVVRCYQYLVSEKKEYVLSKQMLRSGTSIGANLAEANGAISMGDFASKVSISYKECQETKYWLQLLKDTDYLDQTAFASIYGDADELGKILYAILKKANRMKNP